MNREDIQKWAEQMGMVGLDTETLDRLLTLALEAEADVARTAQAPGSRRTGTRILCTATDARVIARISAAPAVFFISLLEFGSP